MNMFGPFMNVFVLLAMLLGLAWYVGVIVLLYKILQELRALRVSQR
jgi:hypothetical protein